MKEMEEIVKLLDENLEYVKHEVSGDRITIWVKSTKNEVICPYCGKPSKKVHSRYERSFQDLPIQGKKTIVVIRR
jgi:transposase